MFKKFQYCSQSIPYLKILRHIALCKCYNYSANRVLLSLHVISNPFTVCCTKR